MGFEILSATNKRVNYYIAMHAPVPYNSTCMFVAYIRMKDTLIAKYFYNGKRRKKKVIKRYTNKIHRLKSRSYNEKLKTKFFFYQAKDESFSLPILMIFLNISQRTPF